ncbi:MAG: family 65 glycosyl hydrolase domain-containing protein [Saprospiraceae bacterium]|nr:family 65 glycosyl hydrolase domain-containing protein [Saprospiraceae bacterium]
MKHYLKHHPWQIIEEGFHREFHEVSESICSLGNGRFGLRGNFEEDYSGKSLRGSYFAGVYYPDLTRVGWWKNGYPEYFAKVLNSVNWIGVHIFIDGEVLDLDKTQVSHFVRTLDMEQGLLTRSFDLHSPSGGQLSFHFERFCSMADADVAAIRISIKSEGYQGKINLEPYLDFDVHNKDSNYGDQFWDRVAEAQDDSFSMVSAITKKTAFTVSSFMHSKVEVNGHPVSIANAAVSPMKVSRLYTVDLEKGEELILHKTIVNLSSLYVHRDHQPEEGKKKIGAQKVIGYTKMKRDHIEAWQKIWDGADIIIDGNIMAQQGIRFNIFQLWQTYTGADARLNIGPKGFTGEKYGGSTYWDTEAYCIPFYLGTADAHIARNLLVYRYLHLQKAIENAAKLGFTDGAALYPMVTINGEECHNEWEITFEEIHRNGAMVYAIYDYIKYTGDTSYLTDGGLEVMIGIARFWSQRVNYSQDKKAWVMLGVTGPNEYENNVNNNWYTNYLASWCMQYAIEQIDWVRQQHPDTWARVSQTSNFKDEETGHWQERINGMYYPRDENRNVFLQQDGFLDKDLMRANDLPAEDRPIHQKWSWDRILRSCFIKQADVLQGMYFFEDHFDEDTHRRHFDFYEPMTVHESSLSPCVHAILASRLGKPEKANEMYLRTSRLDLDDYNNDTADGLHITSMAGSWMSVVRGFAGMQVKDGLLHLAPVLPAGWAGFSFKIHYRQRSLGVTVTREHCEVSLLTGEPLEIVVNNKRRQL